MCRTVFPVEDVEIPVEIFVENLQNKGKPGVFKLLPDCSLQVAHNEQGSCS